MRGFVALGGAESNSAAIMLLNGFSHSGTNLPDGGPKDKY
jgi:hypothetical protein